MKTPDFYRGVGIENTWIAQTDRPGKRVLDVYDQMGHDTRWEEDLARARDLGINAIRYSIPWYRGEPEPGRYDLSPLVDRLEWLRRHDIVPIVDLIHYGTPTWMDNGILNHAFPERLADYADAFARRFAGVVDHYTPVNEPQTAASMSGWHGVWPPYLSGVDGWLRLCLPMARAVILCTKALRAACPQGVLISADCDFTPPFALIAKAAALRETPLDAATQLIHESFTGMLAYGAVPDSHPTLAAIRRLGASEAALEWLEANAERPDIVGFNYYPDFARTPYPEAGRNLFARLVTLNAILELPVYVAETSAGSTAEDKCAWMAELATLCRRARDEDLPLRGVNWWPLFDTVQWDYRDNGKPLPDCIVPGGWNNGLYATEGDLGRVPTGAVEGYRRFCASFDDDDRGLPRTAAGVHSSP